MGGLAFRQTSEVWTYQETKDSIGKGPQLNQTHNIV